MCHSKCVVCTREGCCFVMYQCHFQENVLCNLGEVLALNCDCLFWEKSHPTSLMKDQGLHPNLWAIKCRLASRFFASKMKSAADLDGVSWKAGNYLYFPVCHPPPIPVVVKSPRFLDKNVEKCENNVIKIGKLTKSRMTWTKVVIFVFATFWPPNRLMAHMHWETNKLWANSNKQLLIGRIDRYGS